MLSTVKPLTDNNAELETKIANLESLNRDLSERLTDLQLQMNIFKSERVAAQGFVPQVARDQPEEFNASTQVVEPPRGLFAGAGPQEAPKAWTGTQPPGFGDTQAAGPPQAQGAYAARPTPCQPDPRYLAPELLPHLKQPAAQQSQFQPPATGY